MLPHKQSETVVNVTMNILLVRVVGLDLERYGIDCIVARETSWVA